MARPLDAQVRLRFDGWMTEVSYARTGDGAFLAYSVVGEGPLDVVYTGGYMISIDFYDDEPHVAHIWRRLSSFARLIRFDVRGIGLSDPIDSAGGPTIERMAADLATVIDAVGASQVCLVGDAAAGSAIEYAATHPDRVRWLILVNAAARVARSADYPYGHDQEILEGFLAQNTDPAQRWTEDDSGSDDVALIVPSLANDVGFREWWSRASRRSASPATARAIVGCNTMVDVRARLPEIAAPTLVLHGSRNAFIPVELGRYLADHIPDTTFAEIATADSAMWGDSADEYLDRIEDFTTGQRTSRAVRVLATILFSDIVASTERATELGDRAWRALLDTHDQILRAELTRYGGHEINTTGDGFIASFESPTQAVACAHAIMRAAAQVQLPLRVGIHTGECERRGADLAGIAVHIAARINAIAEPNEILVSRTVVDLTGGSGINFDARGDHELKGIPGTVSVFAATR